MRDIRSDLMERRRLLEADQERLKAARQDIDEKLSKIDLRLNRVAELIEEENELWVSADRSLVDNNDGEERTATSRFILSQLSDNKEHSLDELVELAENKRFPFGEKSPKRVINFTLLGLKAGRMVERTDTNKWKLKKSKSQELIELVNSVNEGRV